MADAPSLVWHPATRSQPRVDRSGHGDVQRLLDHRAATYNDCLITGEGVGRARGGVVEYGRKVDQTRRGTVAGVTAYLIWGMFPLYWPLLEPAGAVEILSHRIAWSVVKS